LSGTLDDHDINKSPLASSLATFVPVAFKSVIPYTVLMLASENVRVLLVAFLKSSKPKPNNKSYESFVELNESE